MKQDKDNRPGIVKACLVVVGTVLILSTAFVFLAFRTDYIFNVDTDTTITASYFERTSVTTIIEEIDELENGSGDLIPTIDIEDVESDWWYPPAAGTTIDVSFGVDAQTEQMVVSSTDTWSLEYSIPDCYKAYGENALCSRRLRKAYELFGVNHNESGDLLKLSVDGTPCFAGAIIGDPFNIGDVICVELTDGTQFYFMMLDAKSNQHTYEELGFGGQVQNKWGHGYPLGGGSVQMSICEFICNQSKGSQSNAKMLPSGAFLNGQKVYRARTVKHVDIDGSGEVTAVAPVEKEPDIIGIPPEEQQPPTEEEQQPTTPPAVDPINPSDAAQALYNYYTGQGYSKAAACVFVANADIESGFNPDAVSKTGEYHGIFQWGQKYGRWQALQAARPNDWNTVQGQMEYAVTEINGQAYYKSVRVDALNNAIATAQNEDSTAAGCTDEIDAMTFLFCKWFEGCGGGSFADRYSGYSKYDKRYTKALEYYATF